jgi:hypothetical protein
MPRSRLSSSTHSGEERTRAALVSSRTQQQVGLDPADAMREIRDEFGIHDGRIPEDDE